MNATVHIEWEHGDADIRQKEQYKFNSKESLDLFLNFLYEMQEPVLRDDWSGRKFWYFEDGHYQRIPEFMDKLHEKYEHKFEDHIPCDTYCSDYRPAINSVHIRIKNKKHHIIWTELINKPENAISLPAIGTETELNTGGITGHEQMFGKKITHCHDIQGLLNEEPVGKHPDTIYPSFTATLIGCHIDVDSIPYSISAYFLLYKVTDKRLDGEHYVLTKKTGFDKDFETKFGKEKYDGMSVYEI